MPLSAVPSREYIYSQEDLSYKLLGEKWQVLSVVERILTAQGGGGREGGGFEHITAIVIWVPVRNKSMGKTSPPLFCFTRLHCPTSELPQWR